MTINITLTHALLAGCNDSSPHMVISCVRKKQHTCVASLIYQLRGTRNVITLLFAGRDEA